MPDHIASGTMKTEDGKELAEIVETRVKGPKVRVKNVIKCQKELSVTK